MDEFITYPLFVFLGPPGSGKGTLASKMAQRYGLLHLSTGDLLRAYCTKDTPQAQEISKLLAQGQLVPPDLFSEIFIERLQAQDCYNGLILDGFPRTLSQAKFLDSLVDLPNRIVFIHVSLNDEEIVRRLSGRRLCPQCKKTYHIDFSPPQVKNLCDTCSTSLIIRTDDKKEVIMNRLSIFHASNDSIRRYYQGRPFWINIQANQKPEECAHDLFIQLENRLFDKLTEEALICMEETL